MRFPRLDSLLGGHVDSKSYRRRDRRRAGRTTGISRFIQGGRRIRLSGVDRGAFAGATFETGWTACTRIVAHAAFLAAYWGSDDRVSDTGGAAPCDDRSGSCFDGGGGRNHERERFGGGGCKTGGGTCTMNLLKRKGPLESTTTMFFCLFSLYF